METEITKKIRTAIENKLIELDSFVDKELPEYIMVMVANKKTKDQMDDDLSLFLGKNVSKFTSWLLKTLHGEKVNKNNELGKPANVIQPSYDEEDILALDAQEQETDEFLQKELGEDPAPQKKKDEVKQVEAPSSQNKVGVKSIALHEVDKDVGRVTAKDVFQKQTSSSSVKTVKQLADSKNFQSKVSSSVVKLTRPTQDIEDVEYDPQNPSINVRSVASKVLPPVRKSSVPLSRQANKLILLKAVDEANKSVLSKKKLEEVYNPTPIKVLTSTVVHHNQNKKLRNEYKPSPILKAIIPHDDKEEEEEEYVPQPYASWQVQNKNSSFPMNAAEEEMDYEDYVPETVGRKVIFNTGINSSSLYKASSKDSPNGLIKIENIVDRPVSPHFVVTLDGFSSGNSRKRSLSQSDALDQEDVENMDTSQVSAVSEEPSTKKLKVPERCHFWPSCKNGDNCEFHHPTTPCKTFPNCKFGVKCLYVHPNCKFDSLCTRKDCPFTHTCKKEFLIAKSLPVRSPYPAKFLPISPPFNPSPAKCKFFPRCTAFKCQFFHPKPCRYGNDCQSQSCTYIHSRFPAPNKLKWTAEASI